MIVIYNCFYIVLKSLLQTFSFLSGKKTKDWIALRDNQDIFKIQIKNTPRIWIHASSGEIEYAKSFIREFKKTYPQSQIFVSYSSLSATSLFKNILSDVAAFFPLNWDTTSDNAKLLEYIKPDILIFSRTDFWLNLIDQATRRNIKLATIAANPKMTWFNKLWHKMACSKFLFFSCVDESQVSWLKKILPHTRVETIPDTRYDQVFFRLSQDPQIKLPENLKLVTFGSTWPKDDEILFATVSELLKKGYSIVWAPHDVKYAKNLFEKLSSKANVKLLSEFQSEDKFEILIIDRLGVLADVYRYSKISFVGGSFVSRVHSVMEPLCAGNFVIVGPFYKNNPEAISFINKNFVKSVSASSEFLTAVNNFETNMNRLSELKIATEKQKGGTIKTVSTIAEILKL